MRRTRGMPSRRRWWMGLGVSAAIILVAALVIPGFFDDRSIIAEPPGGDKWVWIGHNGVQVQVPVSWQFATSHPCQPQFNPDVPRVQLGPDTQAMILLGCTPGAGGPPVDDPPTLTFVRRDDPPVLPAWDRFPKKVINDFLVRVHWGQDYETEHPEITDIATKIIASATAIQTTDENPCPDLPANTLVSRIDDLPEVDRVSIFQYRADTGELRLWSSRQLLGESAQQFTRDMVNLGSQPVEPGGAGCSDDPLNMVVTIHLHGESEQYVVRVNYRGGSDTGIRTATTTVGLNKDLCEQIFRMPTTPTEMAEPLARRCGFTVPTAQPT